MAAYGTLGSNGAHVAAAVPNGMTTTVTNVGNVLPKMPAGMPQTMLMMPMPQLMAQMAVAAAAKPGLTSVTQQLQLQNQFQSAAIMAQVIRQNPMGAQANSGIPGMTPNQIAAMQAMMTTQSFQSMAGMAMGPATAAGVSNDPNALHPRLQAIIPNTTPSGAHVLPTSAPAPVKTGTGRPRGRPPKNAKNARA